MLESYLKIDSKGIIPFEHETKPKYLTRGTDFIGLLLKPRIKENFISNAEKTFSYSIKEIQISEKVDNFFKKKYDCDLRWIPCFKSSRKKFGLLGTCSGIEYKDGPRIYAIPTVFIDLNNSKIMIHELIHAMRKTFLYYEEQRGLIEELFAETCNKLPQHDLFLYHPIKTFKISSKMKSVHNKLSNSFGNKADYIFIRLKEKEIEYLSQENMNHGKIIEFFKEINNNEPKKLRFEIICEKLGL